MKFWEALKALEEGKKVRRIDWAPGKYLVRDPLCAVCIDVEDGDFHWKWEIYQEPTSFIAVSPSRMNEIKLEGTNCGLKLVSVREDKDGMLVVQIAAKFGV